MKYLEVMQIEVMNASNKPRNNSLTIFDTEKYQQQNFSLIEPKNIAFDNIITQKYRTYLPAFNISTLTCVLYEFLRY